MLRPVGLRTLLVALVAVALVSSTAHAQAFLPAQGEGAVSFMFQDQLFKYHALPTVRFDGGPIKSESLLLDVTYGLSDKVAVSLALPVVFAKYTGPFPHPLPDFSGPNPIDLGTWNGAAQDFRVFLRYNMTRNLGNKGIVVTPFVGSIVPSHDYQYFAHAAVGLDLKEVDAGVSVAKMLDSILPGLLVQGRYAYGFVQSVLDISHNRSLASLEVAYFATPALRLMALSSGQVTHGGVDISIAWIQSAPTIQLLHHDQIGRDNMLNVGAGATYSISQSVDIFGSLLRAVAQRNGHILDRGISVGVSWSFTTPLAKNRAVGTTAENSLAKCLCEKSSK